MDFDTLREELKPYSVTWLIGSRAWGLNAEDADFDTLTIYHHAEDDRRVFRRYPDSDCSPNDDHKLYSLRQFCRMLAKGNPNIVEIFGREPLEQGEHSAFILWVLGQVAPHRFHKGFYGAALGSANSDIKGALKIWEGDKFRADNEPGFVAPSDQTRKKLSQAMKVATFAVRAYSNAEMTAEDIEAIRAIKFGPTPFEVALELVKARLTELEGIHNGILPSDEELKAVVDKEFTLTTQEKIVNATDSTQ